MSNAAVLPWLRVRRRRRRKPPARVVLLIAWAAGNLWAFGWTVVWAMTGGGAVAGAFGCFYVWMFMVWRQRVREALRRWHAGRPLAPVHWVEWVIVGVFYLPWLLDGLRL